MQATVGLSIESTNTLDNIPDLLCKNTNPSTLLSLYPSILQLLNEVIALSHSKEDQPEEVYQQRGIFERNVQKKRRKTQVQPTLRIDNEKLAFLLVNWLEEVAPTKCWPKISTLSTEISKLNLLNKYP
jgi:hypothetical protein